MTPLEALHRCQRAWEATQPQLFFDLWPDGLDEPQTSALRFVEPAACPPEPPPGGGLAAGAEPGRDHRELTAGIPSPPDPDSSFAAASPVDASAPPINQTAPGRTSPEDVRDQGQEVTL
jgi:hypothetical protein